MQKWGKGNINLYLTLDWKTCSLKYTDIFIFSVIFKNSEAPVDLWINLKLRKWLTLSESGCSVRSYSHLGTKFYESFKAQDKDSILMTRTGN